MPDFIETQTYGWVFNISIAMVLLALIAFAWKFLNKKIYILCCVPFVLLVANFMVEKMETRIDDTGIHYSMWPAQTGEKLIEWDQVSYISLRGYIMYSGRTVGYDVYSVNDQSGLYIFMMNGNKVILGTRKPAEVKAVIREMISRGRLSRYRWVR